MLEQFFKSEFDIGKFRDVGHAVGVNRFNQAGGAIMDDFDNDGLLDLVRRKLDSTRLKLCPTTATRAIRLDDLLAWARSSGILYRTSTLSCPNQNCN